MSHLPLGLIIEGLVAILLVLTITYCAILNSRLKRLRSDEQALRATISELITTTEIAERAILGLKTTAAECDQTIAQRLIQAEHLSGELARQLDTGETVLTRITQIAEAAGRGQAGGAAPAHRGAAHPAQPYQPHPAQGRAEVQPEPAPQAAKSLSAQDLRAAAAEAAARLERFRQRSGERAA
ncbi:hypothetical protein C8N35_102488 [Breoghania corrubedonensis]|uniref:DUF6468 domain-containing protein n=1 Tax=Breoghania corrubedonensis TaxID=665038 RepID=A0A2T5VDF2_9HYPH|nr:DUF6468 domain-containing protein [Breoghania corrubedonensis]PTW61772.1 hypothetical protein C8N35_102488 [Breoghania corrubedonensis]